MFQTCLKIVEFEGGAFILVQNLSLWTGTLIFQQFRFYDRLWPP